MQPEIRPVVRAGTRADVLQVVSVKLASWSDTYMPLIGRDVLNPFLAPEFHLPQIERSLSANGVLLVATIGEPTVVGFALSILGGSGEQAFLDALHVRPEARGSGIGKLLFEETARHLRSRGIGALELHVLKANRRAQSFYARMGGTPVGTTASSWGETSVEEIVYRWPL